MGRRSRKANAEVMLQLAALLPWWLAVVLAVVSYLVLHQVSQVPVHPPTQLGQMGNMMIQTYIRAGASIGQYVLPLVLLIGAVVSFVRRRARVKLMDDVRAGEDPGILQGMSWREFESLVGEAFRLQGYSALESGHLGGGADGGVDRFLRKEGKTYLVQCKQWRSTTVDVRVVRELYGVMAARSGAGGFVVTSGRFTSEAQSFARGKTIRLIDGPALHSMLRAVRSVGRPPVAAYTPSAAPGLRAVPKQGVAP